ncbi:MAG: phosphoribosylamine--glycine ligase [Candidatus Krumholzibacteria bacterium]|jgi:phosphoribosylamine--glycine ligase|nr:phosphoribosylamine--glycine ligase [Candidatus Krumholzibacteria bacterium]
MKVLVLGSGGREHALVWKIAQSDKVGKIYAAPGNAGIAELAERVDIDVNDKKKLLEFAIAKGVDLTVVGPEAPLVSGIVDLFADNGRRIFGFDGRGALLEGSKVWAKEFMRKYRIPTGGFAAFNDHCAAQRSIEEGTPPFVIKADGLAAGKGVFVCETREQARNAAERMMKAGEFGEAGKRVVIEEYLEGPELSILAVFDGKDYRLFAASQDHKRAFDGDTGPNTGGMGAYSPVPWLDHALSEKIRIEIIEPTLNGIQAEKISGAGVIYFGLMITGEGPKVLEYNCRFGDPETQVILPLFKGDLFEVLYEATGSNLESVDFENSADSCACVVIASGGYPGPYRKGHRISGLEEADDTGCILFHAGTAIRDGEFVNDGGRVLCVTAVARNLNDALEKAYRGAGMISFQDCFYRRDIGRRALES